MFALNCAFLITTGNRGGIVTLVFGLIIFMYLFRKELGNQAIVRYVFGGVLLFSVMAVVVVQYTEFNVLFDRIENTEMDGVVPDSRSGWEFMLPKVLEEPILGHGPRLRLHADTYDNHRNIYPMPYPHSAYMYLMYSIGGVGLFAYFLFFLSVWMHFIRASKTATDDKFLGGLPKLSIIILLMIAISQIRMEMFRFITNDDQQFVLMLLAALLALTQARKSAAPSPEKISKAVRLDEINTLDKRVILRSKHSELNK